MLTKFCVCGGHLDMSVGFEFREDWLKVWELWGEGVKIAGFPFSRHIAYTTACCYHTSRDGGGDDAMISSSGSYVVLSSRCLEDKKIKSCGLESRVLAGMCVRPFRPRLRRDLRRTAPRPRRWALCLRRDRDHILCLGDERKYHLHHCDNVMTTMVVCLYGDGAL